jgi:DNA-binding winged helix-turn-helix (wHTH) protein/mono/diheme cytochrome c family protein/thioredoxin-like negative regulator of GroEL
MSNLYRFGKFVLDPGRRTLSRAGLPISLTPKAFDVLLFLVQNPNRLVAKEELLKSVWGDTFVEEGNLTQYISHLRKALGDNSEDSRLIVTIARKGYQFTAGVIVVAETADIAKHATLQAAVIETSKTDALPTELPTKEKVTKSPSPRLRLRKWFAAAALMVVIAAVCWLYWTYHRPVTLSATDTIVLADVKNETGDPVFDDALDTALRYEMDQTPYLNILGMDKVLGTLAQLTLPPTTKLTPEVARRICGRTNSKLVISQSISDAGNGYHLQMRALDCGSGATLAQEQAGIGKRDEVVHELGVTAARLRAKLGEPSDSLARFNQPLEKALSPSLEALQAATQGLKLSLAGDAQGGLKLFQRAIELDPNFAVAYGRLGATYLFLGNTELSEASYTRAYQLRDRLTEKGRLGAEINYYSTVIGDWEKEYSSALRFLEIFPRDAFGHVNLREAFVHLGQPDRAADEAAEVARLRPSAYYFGSAIQSIRFASRFNEAKSWLAKADALKFDSSLIRRERLIVAFATGDRDNVEKILQQEEQGKYREDFLYEHALIEIQRGRFQSAERLRLQALGSTPKASNADSWVIPAALEDAEVGKDAQARRYESKAAASPLDRNGKIALAQALARSGRTAEAGAFAQSAGGMLTEKQIDVITTGIRERWSKPDVLNGTNPPPYSSTTPGDSSRGSQVYGTFCSSCHGVVGKGGLKASSIVDGSFLALLNDQELRTIVIVGRPDLGAPDWRNNVPGTSMSAQDVSDVVAWLASQRSKFPGQPYPSTTKSLGEVR